MEACLLLIRQASDCGAVSLFSGRQTTKGEGTPWLQSRVALEGQDQKTGGKCGPQLQQPPGTLEHSLSAAALWRKMNPWPHIQWWASHTLLVGVPGVPVEVTFLHSLYLVPFQEYHGWSGPLFFPSWGCSPLLGGCSFAPRSFFITHKSFRSKPDLTLNWFEAVYILNSFSMNIQTYHNRKFMLGVRQYMIIGMKLPF